MEDIKVEAYHPSLCHGCLTQDRKTVQLPQGELSQIFLYLVIPQTYASSEAAAFCWECTAMLRRLSRFRNQLAQAHDVLMKMYYQMNAEIPSLSKLSTNTKVEYDQKYEYMQYIENDTNKLPIQLNPVVKTDNFSKAEEFTEIEPQIQSTDENIIEFDDIDHDFDYSDLKLSPETDDNTMSLENDKKSTNNRKIRKVKSNIGSKIMKNDMYTRNTRSSSRKRKINDSEDDIPNMNNKKIKLPNKNSKNLDNTSKNDNNTNKTGENEKNEHNSNKNDKNRYNTDKDNAKQKKNDTPKKKTFSVSAAKRHAIIKNVDIDWNSVNLDEYFSKTSLDEDEVLEYRVSRYAKRKTKERMLQKCKICNKKFCYKQDVTRHNDLNHQKGPKFECHGTHKSKYKRIYRTLEELKEHWRSHYQFYKCSLCQQYCLPRTLMNHMMQYHTKIYSCTKCKHELCTSRLFNRHYEDKHAHVICDVCGAAYRMKKRLIQHIENNHTNNICTKCNKSFKNSKYFRCHMLNRHTDPIDKIDDKEALKEAIRVKEASYCIECDKQFTSVSAYKSHYSSVHKLKTKEPCLECGKLVPHGGKLSHYNFNHLKKTEYYCEKCDKYFYSRQGLKWHIRYVHLKEPKVRDQICDICERAFTNKKTLRHHRLTHTGERPHACNYCPATFIQRTPWIIHETKQHGAVHITRKTMPKKMATVTGPR